jgi:hypothetical protein
VPLGIAVLAVLRKSSPNVHRAVAFVDRAGPNDRLPADIAPQPADDSQLQGRPSLVQPSRNPLRLPVHARRHLRLLPARLGQLTQPNYVPEYPRAAQ